MTLSDRSTAAPIDFPIATGRYADWKKIISAWATRW
jgi:hypothetical protein